MRDYTNSLKGGIRVRCGSAVLTLELVDLVIVVRSEDGDVSVQTPYGYPSTLESDELWIMPAGAREPIAFKDKGVVRVVG